MGAKSAALGFSRPTDNFRSVAWRETVVQWAPAIVPAARPKLTGRVPAGAPHVPVPVGNNAALQGPMQAPVVAHMEELQRKLRSSVLCAAQRIEQDRNFIGDIR